MENKGAYFALILVMVFAAGALAADEKAAIAAYKEAMKSKKERERIAAVCGLAEVPGKKVTSLIRKAVRSDRSERVQAAAALALARRGDPKDLRYLLSCLRGLKKKPIALAGAVDGIGEYREPKTAEALFDVGRYWMAKHKQPTLAAIRALGAIRSADAIELLLKLYDQTYVQGGAGAGLAGPSDSGSVASGYTSDDTQARMSDFRPYIVGGLRRITGVAYGDDLEAWQEWWADNEKTFDPASIEEDPNRTMGLTDTRCRYSIVRPNEDWKWRAEPEPGFDRTAVLTKEGKAVGHLSILAYSTWAREPSSLAAMAKNIKEELERTVSPIQEQTWDQKVKVGSVEGIRHRVVGVRDKRVAIIERTILVHREFMYVIDLSLTREVFGYDREDARRFVDSFRLLE
jgi:hypothetical protein